MGACFSRNKSGQQLTIIRQESAALPIKRDLPIVKNGFWLGPYDVRVPEYVEWVMAEDGGNNIYKSGGMTEMACHGFRLTEAEYKQNYAVQDSKGVWWYNKTHCDSWNKV